MVFVTNCQILFGAKFRGYWLTLSNEGDLPKLKEENEERGTGQVWVGVNGSKGGSVYLFQREIFNRNINEILEG
jgi:hypothetical protein